MTWNIVDCSALLRMMRVFRVPTAAAVSGGRKWQKRSRSAKLCSGSLRPALADSRRQGLSKLYLAEERRMLPHPWQAMEKQMKNPSSLFSQHNPGNSEYWPHRLIQPAQCGISSGLSEQTGRDTSNVELYIRGIMLRTDLCGVSLAKARNQGIAGRIASHKKSEGFQ